MSDTTDNKTYTMGVTLPTLTTLQEMLKSDRECIERGLVSLEKEAAAINATVEQMRKQVSNLDDTIDFINDLMDTEHPTVQVKE